MSVRLFASPGLAYCPLDGVVRHGAVGGQWKRP